MGSLCPRKSMVEWLSYERQQRDGTCFPYLHACPPRRVQAWHPAPGTRRHRFSETAPL